MNLLRRYAALQGSPGAAWDPRLPCDGAVYFPKWAGSAFVNKEFESWLKAQRAGELALCGLKASACIAATARDAMARGYRVRLIGEGIACSSERSKTRALSRLVRAGATLAA